MTRGSSHRTQTGRRYRGADIPASRGAGSGGPQISVSTEQRKSTHNEGVIMAKDKGTKPGKETKGATSAFAKPSEATGGGDNWSLTDGDEPKSGKNEGSLFLFTPLRKESTDVTRGKKTESVDIIVADIVEINEKKPAKSELHEDSWVFPKYVQGSLRGYIGEQKVLGRLIRVDDKTSAVGYHWELSDATPAEEALALEYMATVDPFKQSGSEKKKSKK